MKKSEFKLAYWRKVKKRIIREIKQYPNHPKTGAAKSVVRILNEIGI